MLDYYNKITGNSLDYRTSDKENRISGLSLAMSNPDEKGRSFRLKLLDDNVQELLFVPYFHKDMPNNPARKDYHEQRISSIDGTRIMGCIWSDRRFDDYQAFVSPVYRTYGEFVMEFKDKVGGYLPKYFDWSSHLGRLSYVRVHDKKYMLITVENTLTPCISPRIKTEQFETYEGARAAAQTALRERLRLDGDEKEMPLLKDGIKLSNAELNDDNARIFRDCGQTRCHWKIVEI